MATRTALLNGNVINRDCDFSKHIEAVSEPGVISGLAVTSSSVAVGEAFVKCERTNGDVIYALVYVNEAVSISGDGDVYIEVSQEIIDNGELGNEDGTGIATVEVGTLPDKNALLLATITSGEVEDKRNMIKRVGELKTSIDTNTTDIADLDERVEALEEAGAIDHLEGSGIVGELYTLNDVLFKQNTPSLSDAVEDYCNVGDVAANTEIHIQRIASGVASNQLKLKVKAYGSPTTGLVVEVRKGVLVTVTANEEAYWYGDSNNIIATGSIAYGDISSTASEITVTLDANFGGTKGELLDVVVYQTGSIVNASNYYILQCASGQYSEGFSYVSVNGSTRTRSKFMPYCVSDGALQIMLCKASPVYALATAQGNITRGQSEAQIFSQQATISGKYAVKFSYSYSPDYDTRSATWYVNTYVNSASAGNFSFTNGDTGSVILWSGDLTPGDTLTIGIYCSKTRATNYDIDFGFKGEFLVKLQPKEVKQIGELGIGTSIGTHIDGTFYGGIMLEKTQEATAGSITPGDFVGYIKVNFNGEIVKIPYYS